MSELHKFLFDGMPVRGMLVRLTDAWMEVLRRRGSNSSTGAYPEPVRSVLGEMLAAATLMQSSIRFEGALVLQMFGDGPLKLAVAEVGSDLALRATATVLGEAPQGVGLSRLVNLHNQGRCAVTLDPLAQAPGRQPYQGVVPLSAPDGTRLERISDVLQQYMLQSEQLDATLVLAADDRVAAGLLIQRLPLEGSGNLGAAVAGAADGHGSEPHPDYQRIALLAASLKREELLGLDVDTILRRLFWQEPLTRFEPAPGAGAPHFACSCSRERVEKMIRGLGRQEADSIVTESGMIEVACEFCGRQYRFDAVDAAGVFAAAGPRPPASSARQ